MSSSGGAFAKMTSRQFWSLTDEALPTYSATELFALDESNLVEYLRRKYRANYVFIMSDVAGMSSLSRDDQARLRTRVRDALRRLNISLSRLIERYGLSARWMKYNVSPDNHPEDEPSRARSQTPDSVASIATAYTDAQREHAYYNELVKHGGRPVCSIYTLLNILDGITSDYKSFEPWLRPKSREADIKTVFERQIDRWWDFRKWQFDNRDDLGGDGGVAAWTEAQRGSFGWREEFKTEPRAEFEETMERIWREKETVRMLPQLLGFNIYKIDVLRRLVLQGFYGAIELNPMELNEDPLKQDKWTTWLEYVVYEQHRLERRIAEAEEKEMEYNKAWKLLLGAVQSLPHQDPDQNGLRHHSEAVLAAKAVAAGFLHSDEHQEAATFASKEGMEMFKLSVLLEEFKAATESLPQAKEAMNIQKKQFEWALKEARVLEVAARYERMGNRINKMLTESDWKMKPEEIVKKIRTLYEDERNNSPEFGKIKVDGDGKSAELD